MEALILLKPDASYRLMVRHKVFSWLIRQQYGKLLSLKWFLPPEELIQQHYSFLSDRPFFPWLVKFMTTLPILVGKIQVSDSGLAGLRFDLGETQAHIARPNSIREMYGIYGGVNCVHLSDSPESAVSEVALWEKYVELSGGVDVDFSEPANAPDYTHRLRSLASLIKQNLHKDEASKVFTELLAAESQLNNQHVLCEIILESFEV
jgi:nucleoside-diphosphate kinase